jgi:hypothetical protein
MWPGHRDADIDFYLTIVRSYPEVLRPHVIVLFRNGKPEAILIGRLEKKRLAFGLGYAVAFRPLCRCLTFVYSAIRGNASAQNTRALVQEVMACLKRDEADVAMLEFVPLDSPLYQLATTVPGATSRDMVPASQKHDVMIIPASMDEVYRRMSGTRRKHIRRSVEKLQTHPAGTPRIICYRDSSELDHLFQDAEEIARKTYQRGLRAGFMDTPAVRMRLELAARKGWLRAYLLYLGDRPCAFWIGMLYGDTYVSEYMGYDPQSRQFSPGMVLLMRVIEGFCNRSSGDTVREIDFGLGHAEYKETLCSKEWLEASVYIFSPTLKGAALKAIRITTGIIDLCGRRILVSTKLLPRIKRAWRDRLSRPGNLPPEISGPTRRA